MDRFVHWSSTLYVQHQTIQGGFILSLPNSQYKSDFINFNEYRSFTQVWNSNIAWNPPISTFNSNRTILTTKLCFNQINEDAQTSFFHCRTVNTNLILSILINTENRKEIVTSTFPLNVCCLTFHN